MFGIESVGVQGFECLKTAHKDFAERLEEQYTVDSLHRDSEYSFRSAQDDSGEGGAPGFVGGWVRAFPGLGVRTSGTRLFA